jgi:hypothetical protein
MVGSQKVQHSRIKALFGAPPLMLAKLWELLLEHADPLPIKARRIHMLWALHLAKVYANVHVMATTVSTPCKKTY